MSMRIALVSNSSEERQRQRAIAEQLNCDIIVASRVDDIVDRLSGLDVIWAHGIDIDGIDFENIVISDGKLPERNDPDGKAWLRRLKSSLTTSGREANYVICLASSTGGLSVVRDIITQLPAFEDTAIVVVQHQEISAQKTMVEQLARRSSWCVSGSDQAPGIYGGQCVVAVGSHTINFGAQGKIIKSDHQWPGAYRPSIDHMVGSIVIRWGVDALIIYLSGLEGEGPTSARLARRSGASVWIQDPDSADAPGMPETVKRSVDDVASMMPDLIASNIELWLNNRRNLCHL
jgi:two-component system chemotaxis response regulator CheB